MDDRRLLQFAVEMGELMLSSGAETSRVEQTMELILGCGNFKADIYATPTGIFTSILKEDGSTYTNIKRINNFGTNFSKLDLVNSLSRKFCANQMDLEEAFEQLHGIKNADEFGKVAKVFATSATSAFFVLVFGGRLGEFILAGLSGFVLGLVSLFIIHKNLSKFTIPFIGGIASVTFAFLLHSLTGMGGNMGVVIIGSIMPLVPGLAITNGIRDTIEGDLVSGVSRIADAFIVAALIASGVGIVISVYTSYGGVI